MTYTAAPQGTPQEVALQLLLRAIAARDRSSAARLLAESPSLAQQAIAVGATRAVETPYYFAAITRFVYAGDTPLHIAAAAYETGIAKQLVSRGAHVRAATGAGPNRFTTRPMGFQDRMRGTRRRNLPPLSS